MDNEPTETPEEESERLIAEFLEKGGKITQCDYAATRQLKIGLSLHGVEGSSKILCSGCYCQLYCLDSISSWT